MSISTRQNDLVRYQKGLSDLEKKLSDESKKEVSKMKELDRIERSITKTTTVNSLRIKQQKITRIMDDISKIRSKKAELSKKIAEQNNKLQKANTALRKEEENERNKIQIAEKKIKKSN